MKTSKRPEATENLSDYDAIGLVLHLTGCEGGASFLDQTQCGVKKIRYLSQAPTPVPQHTLVFFVLSWKSKVVRLHRGLPRPENEYKKKLLRS